MASLFHNSVLDSLTPAQLLVQLLAVSWELEHNYEITSEQIFSKHAPAFGFRSGYQLHIFLDQSLCA
jgi:hypothetical protein